MSATQLVTFTEEHATYVASWGGNCRDCADENGVCPNSGLPCGDARKAIDHVFKAIAYGVKNKFISNPFATPPAAPASAFVAADRIREYLNNIERDGHHSVDVRGLLLVLEAEAATHPPASPASAPSVACRYRRWILDGGERQGKTPWYYCTQDPRPLKNENCAPLADFEWLYAAPAPAVAALTDEQILTAARNSPHGINLGGMLGDGVVIGDYQRALCGVVRAAMGGIAT